MSSQKCYRVKLADLTVAKQESYGAEHPWDCWNDAGGVTRDAGIGGGWKGAAHWKVTERSGGILLTKSIGVRGEHLSFLEDTEGGWNATGTLLGRWRFFFDTLDY